MKRDFLKELGISDDAINSIMAENGKDIQQAKGEAEKLSAENEQLKSELEKANGTLEKFKDYDDVKAEVEKYKAETQKSKADYEQKIADMELTAKVKDFTGSKKFVNDFTRDAINQSLKSALNEESNKGKSLEDLLQEITKDKTDIFINENAPVPPVTPNMNQNPSDENGVLAAFKRMNPNIKF